MKRTLVMLLTITLLLGGCRRQTTPLQILDEVLQYADIPCVRVYAKGRKVGTHELTKDKTETLYGCNIREFAADYAIALTGRDEPAEVHIIKAKNETSALFIEKILSGRLDKLSDAEQEFYRTNAGCRTGCVMRYGTYVFLVFSTNTEQTVKSIEKFF